MLKNKPQTAPKQGRNIKRILIDNDYDYRQDDYDDRHDDCGDHDDDVDDDGRQWEWD